MNSRHFPHPACFWILCGVIVLAACSPAPAAVATPTTTPTILPPTAPPVATSTPTPTQVLLQMDATTPPVLSRCDGLSGALELQVLVGPAEAAGMEPFAVGQIPFTVGPDPDYPLQGGGPVTYEQVQQEDWGTYTVRLDLDTTLDGRCAGQPGDENLEITVQMSGDQMVEVRAAGFSGDYPWSGNTRQQLVFPLEEGSSQSGEGYRYVLHLDR